MMNNIFEIFGQSLFVIAVFLFIILILALIFGKILLKRNILIFPKLIIFALDVFYSPLKQLAKSLGFDEVMVDHIGVEVRNKINETKFEEIDNEKKILVLPHCLRNPKCEAILDETGLVCNCCGKCAIGIIKSKAENMGYKVFVIPGSTFIKNIIKNNEFEAVLGVACYEDLNLSMMKLANFNPQGVLLSRTGCFNTKVDVKNVLNKIGYKEEYETNKDINNVVNPCSEKKINRNNQK
ncbi:hypothetical protein MBCUT_11410 [Methanobrevibacter cuticularis]|uniref:DUF116 domain-containing protein n=1 Tax=Methanobrevibacter cuticularis TaxID=47311 RepID=A0A166DVU9_9EURY|nr:DUF116 domain-containing protein [Methanobrevibacter cuticularis]KZX16005.1 hypothetical protein MBCUT_11410 [Methanobrevibacter cuticularis]